MSNTCSNMASVVPFLKTLNSNHSILQASKLINNYIFCRAKSSKSSKSEHDVIIVGGGIVGMATARELLMRHPALSVAVVEKEKGLASHQSGHNSGVIHAGIYYTPGSLRAKLCVEGLDLAYKYCDQFGVPYKKCGKLIVAVRPQEIARLDKLFERGVQNGVKDLRIVGSTEIKEIEPNCKGLKAIHSPHTGIVDWGLVTRSYGKTFQQLGGKIYTDYQVTSFTATKESKPGSQDGINFPITIYGKLEKNSPLRCKYVVTCGGLQSDRLAQLSGCDRNPRILPFRGEYLELVPEKHDLIRGNIYPVPDPRFPFLGVHFTPRIDGRVLLGPNAVLAFKREGYGYTQFSLSDMMDALSYRYDTVIRLWIHTVQSV
ncbi:L-2-hydroxyglutarate dehydrogenase, mitochondrial-like isoform X2 [Gigantopelta aegis]|uniref:L-2-hydroxyglutarate dehydrogenase, mitochondrial-like isoform X2 n=1 Tax=Gigantopelta aegis TaxID=1735272 RepID=UPI001B88E26E|nr:L-2-hydroxyglutarate dehydrogenase, mitochondrial-like isoform X2 [Gigantopelta aegis]